MENFALKIRLVVLWLVLECVMLVAYTLEPFTPGFIEDIFMGKISGIQITPELMLVFAIIFLIPPVMAFLSITLKDSINRWTNIILGIVYAGVSLTGPGDYLSKQSAYSAWVILIGIVGFVFAALIVWYAWKWQED